MAKGGAGSREQTDDKFPAFRPGPKPDSCKVSSLKSSVEEYNEAPSEQAFFDFSRLHPHAFLEGHVASLGSSINPPGDPDYWWAVTRADTAVRIDASGKKNASAACPGA